MARQFNRAANTYDAVAQVQSQIADELLDRLATLKQVPACVLDVGSGTGHCAKALCAAYPNADVFATDIALHMLQQQPERGPASRGHLVCADFHALPFLPDSFDLIISNMAFHWACDWEKLLRGLELLLKPGGVLLCSVAGPNTFYEWQRAWEAVDQDQHHLSFPRSDQLAAWLPAAGFSDVVVDSAAWEVLHASFAQLHQAIKASGTQLPAQPHGGLRGRAVWQSLHDAYAAYCTPEGYWPMSYDVLFAVGHARGHVSASPAVGVVAVDAIKRPSKA